MAKRNQVPEGLKILLAHMKKMARDRRALDRAKNAGRHRFNMGTWGAFYNGAAKAIARRFEKASGSDVFVTPAEFNMCGTAACLLGHMTDIPEFRRKGLRMLVNNAYDAGGDNLSAEGDPVLVKRGEVVEDRVVVIGEKLLGISRDEADYLFTSRTYATDPKVGVEYVQEMIAKYKAGDGNKQHDAR